MTIRYSCHEVHVNFFDAKRHLISSLANTGDRILHLSKLHVKYLRLFSIASNHLIVNRMMCHKIILIRLLTNFERICISHQ